MTKSIQIIGSFFTNYSLARVNRGLAIALDKIQDEYKISLFREKDKIDYYPTESDLERKPELKKLFQPEKKLTDIAIYNDFPKNATSEHGFSDLPGKIKIMYLAWEETTYPAHWVDEINKYLHAVIVTSTHTKNIFKKSGVKVPIIVIPGALDDGVIATPKNDFKIDTGDSFVFLHISTGKKRKGVDLLLRAFYETFSIIDDVKLVIKSFPGPDNNVDELINSLLPQDKKQLKEKIIHINNPNLTDEELSSLHLKADCEVYPTRAEGFRLPILEAMYRGIPVITTNYSGQIDFCNQDTSFMLDYHLEYAKESELVNIGAMWAKPSLEDLKKYMKELFLQKKEIRGIKSEKLEIKNDSGLAKKIQLGIERASQYTWKNSAKKTIKFIKEVEKFYIAKDKNIAVLSFINGESGIADYTKDLYSGIECIFKEFYYLGNKDIADRSEKDEANVLRTWASGENDFVETLELLKTKEIDIFHIQYHSGVYFAPNALDKLIIEAEKVCKKVFLTLHAVRSTSFDFSNECRNLALVDKIFIHNPMDFEYLKTKLNNIELFILPGVEYPQIDKNKLKIKLDLENASPIILTHGLLNTNKGVAEIVKAVAKLKLNYPNILLIALSAVSSNNIHSQGLYEEVLSIIKNEKLEENVRIITDFLDDKFIELFLQTGDVNIWAYKEVGESASASIRKALATYNPTVATDIKMFSELDAEVLKIKDNSVDSIYLGLSEILNNKVLSENISSNSRLFVKKYCFDNQAINLLKSYFA